MAAPWMKALDEQHLPRRPMTPRQQLNTINLTCAYPNCVVPGEYEVADATNLDQQQFVEQPTDPTLDDFDLLQASRPRAVCWDHILWGVAAFLNSDWGSIMPITINGIEIEIEKPTDL